MKHYEKPELEILLFEQEDVITGSTEEYWDDPYGNDDWQGNGN